MARTSAKTLALETSLAEAQATIAALEAKLATARALYVEQRTTIRELRAQPQGNARQQAYRERAAQARAQFEATSAANNARCAAFFAANPDAKSVTPEQVAAWERGE